MTLTSVALHTIQFPFFQRTDNLAEDTDFWARARLNPVKTEDIADKLPNTRDIVLIETTRQLPRPLIGKLLYALREAKVIAFDLMFVDDEKYLRDDEKELYKSQLAQWRRDVASLTKAVHTNGKVILGTWPEQWQTESDEGKPLLGNMRTIWKKTQGASGWEKPNADLWKSARYRAHLLVNADDEDNVVRKVPLFEDTSVHPGKGAPEFEPCLGLAIAAAARGVTPEQLAKLRPHNGVLTLGSHQVRVGDDNLMAIDYVGGRSSFESMANHAIYTKVVDDFTYEPSDFAGKIVIIGEVSLKSKEMFQTPMGEMPGMQIHAHVAATLLSDIGAPVVTSVAFGAAMAFLFCAVLVAPLGRWPLWTSFFLASLEVVTVIVLGIALFIQWHQILPASIPIFAIILTLNAVALYEYRRVRQTLGQFVGSEMIQPTLQSVFQLRLGGRSEEATAFFCDLRGYSALSEQLPPTALYARMNEYTGLLVDVVRRYGGRPIDYQGDGVFVLFERKFAGANYPLQAVRAALEMQQEFQELQEEWAQDGTPPVGVSIGIDTGEMIIGAVGSKQHMKLGAVGDTVNVAARIQRLNTQCGFGVLLTRHTYDYVRDAVKAEACGTFSVHGRVEGVEVFGAGDPVAKAGSNLETVEDTLCRNGEDGVSSLVKPRQQEAQEVL